MTLVRLVDDPKDEFEAALLGSAAVDVPSDAVVHRGLAAIAAASGTAAATSSASAAALAVGASAHGTLPALVLGKWLGIGVAVGALTLGGATIVGGGRTPELARRPVSPPKTVLLAPPEAKSPSVVVAEPVAPGVEPRAITAPAVVRTHPASSTKAVPVDSTAESVVPPEPATPVATSMGIEALSRARLALASRSPAAVLAALDEYERLPRTHVLDAEATMLRLEGLLQAGRVSEARSIARAYLAEHPDSPHGVRLREIENHE